MASPFSSFEKSLIRESCLQEVAALRSRVNRPLTYLGLPSPWMGDITAWRPHLGRVLAVEMEERFIPDLVDRAYTLNLLYQLFYYVGDIDQILQNGFDKYGHTLQDQFPIDLVNLDYCSGLIYEGFERISALESLFRRQAMSLSNRNLKVPYFLLFITHSCHPKAGKQRISKEYIKYLVKDIDFYQDNLRETIENMANWYISDNCPLEYRHKAFVFGKVLQFAQNTGFQVSIENAIAYKGDNTTPMIHYEFEIYPHSLGYPIPADSRIKIQDILDWPVVDVSGSDIASSDRPRLSTI